MPKVLGWLKITKLSTLCALWAYILPATDTWMELPYIQVFFLHSCPSLLKSCHTLQVFLAREIPESKGVEKFKPIHWLSVPILSEGPDLIDLTLIPLLTWAPKASIPLCPMGSLCAMPSPSLMGRALSCPAIANPISQALPWPVLPLPAKVSKVLPCSVPPS